MRQKSFFCAMTTPDKGDRDRQIPEPAAKTIEHGDAENDQLREAHIPEHPEQLRGVHHIRHGENIKRQKKAVIMINAHQIHKQDHIQHRRQRENQPKRLHQRQPLPRHEPTALALRQAVVFAGQPVGGQKREDPDADAHPDGDIRQHRRVGKPQGHALRERNRHIHVMKQQQQHAHALADVRLFLGEHQDPPYPAMPHPCGMRH